MNTMPPTTVLSVKMKLWLFRPFQGVYLFCCAFEINAAVPLYFLIWTSVFSLLVMTAWMGNCFTKYQIIFHSYDTALSLPDDWVIMLKCYISSWLWQWRSNQIFFYSLFTEWLSILIWTKIIFLVTFIKPFFFSGFVTFFFKLATELLCRQWLSASKNNTLRSLDYMRVLLESKGV